jgi:endonuclease/exonuclease/phosphatase family metal-dependent hydrolase
VIRTALVAALSLATGCLGLTDDGTPWEDATQMTGELAPELGPQPAALRSAGCIARIASWNVHFGADVSDLAAQLAASTEIAQADVLIVQEIEAYPGETGTRSARLASALGMTWMYAPARAEDTGTHGIAILSRHPLEAPAVRQLPFYDQPLNPRNRIAIATDVVLGAHRLQIVNVHLDVRLGAVDRIRQLHPAVNDIADRVLVGGDFNTNPWAWVDGILPLTGTEAIVGQQQAAVVDDYLTGKDFTGAIPLAEQTMRLPGIGMRIDNFYARGMPIVASGVEHVGGSDHWPIWVDLDLCASP